MRSAGRVGMDGLTRWRLASRYISNWYLVAPLLRAVVPGFFPFRGGLRGKRMGRLEVTVRLRNGYRLKCRLDELEGVYAPLVHHEYDVPGFELASARTIIDAGANVGGAALWFAWQAPEAHIIALEPDPETLTRLRENVSGSSIEDRVTTSGKALAGHSGTVYMEREAWSVATKTVTVPAPGLQAIDASSLADVMDEAGFAMVDLLKLDCEGAEWEVLLGADDRTLRRCRAITAECHMSEGRDTRELVARLEAAGFEVWPVYRQPADHDMLSARQP